MSEREVLKSAFAAVPSPDARMVAAARAKLLGALAEIDRARALRRQRRLRLAVTLAAVAAGALVTVTLVVPRGQALTGEQIAAATRRAVAPSPGVIRHVVVNVRYQQRSRVGALSHTRSQTDQWVASGPPYHIHTTWTDLGGVGWYRSRESETTRCGRIDYFPAANLITVNTGRLPERELRLQSDPARAYRVGSGPIRSRGETTFRGVPAYWLVQTWRDTTFVYVVRRDTFYPLRTIIRHEASMSVWTFSTFERIPRSTRTERLLRVAPRPDAFLLRTSPPAHSDCRLFGTYAQLMGKAARR